MRKTTLAAAVAATFVAAGAASADHIWINEFHYDDIDADGQEFVEVGIRTPNASGLNAGDYNVVLVNGNGNTAYNSFNLGSDFTASAAFPVAGSTNGQEVTLYSLILPSNGIQNGSPDGIAITNASTGDVVQFLSYEGTMTFNGVDSMDVGVTESNSTAEFSSLGATGTGFGADQFGADSYVAFPATATVGLPNVGQVFAVPEPASLALLGLGGLAALRRCR